MRQKVVAVLMAFILCFGGICFFPYKVQAEEPMTGADNSYLNTGEMLIGNIAQPMGYYLVDGTSSITKNSAITIGAGGTTSAARRCDVSIAVIVEQYKNGVWGHWHSWTVEEEDEYSAVAAKTLAVARGYSYRVRCTHKAGTDTSSSWTGALQM